MTATSLQNVTSLPNPSAFPEAWIERLFLRFSAMYGSKFADLWRGCDIASVKKLWAEELAGIDANEIKRGVDACKTRDWPPTLPEFLKLCRPPVDFERAFAEAATQIVLRDSGRDEWSHPAIFWAAVEVGAFDLRNGSWQNMRQRWTSALSAQLAKGAWPTIPQRAEALPAPGGVHPSPERVAEIAETAKRSTTDKRDHLAWAKELRDRHESGERLAFLQVRFYREALGIKEAAA